MSCPIFSEKDKKIKERLNQIDPRTGKKFCYGRQDCLHTGDCSTCSKETYADCYGKSFDFDEMTPTEIEGVFVKGGK